MAHQDITLNYSEEQFLIVYLTCASSYMDRYIKHRHFFILSSSDLSVELPFTLTHPKPPETPPPSRPVSANPQGGDADSAPVDTNLIQLDTK